MAYTPGYGSSTPKAEKPKLSLLAAFDDHTRMFQKLAESFDDNFDEPIKLFQNYEHNRKKWILSSRESASKDSQIAQLKQDNHLLKVRLESIRIAYGREMKAKETLQKDYNDLRNKLVLIQDLLAEEHNQNARQNNPVVRTNSVLSVLSDINNKLPPSTSQLNSRRNKQHNESDDGLLFDKSDDTIDDMDVDQHRDHVMTAPVKIARLEEPTYAEVNFGVKNSPVKGTTVPKQTAQQQQQQKAIYSQVRSCSDLINRNIYLQNANNRGQHPSTIVEENEQESNMNLGYAKDGDNDMDKQDDGIGSIPRSSGSSLVPPATDFVPAKSKSTANVVRRKSSKLMTRFNMMRSAAKLEPNRLDSRPHSFQPKKAFMSVTCGPCGKSIGFCSSYLVCVDCHGAVHQRCQDQLPKPCIPFVASGAAIRKMMSSGQSGVVSGSHMIRISDFTSLKERPCVPALLVHSCNELNKRIDAEMNKWNPNAPQCGIDGVLVGLYRVNGSEREIRDLRSKFLDPKSGIPNLASIYDPNVICGVVKSFLKDLDDPLVTSVLWNDFIRAAEHVEELASNSTSDYDSRYEEEQFDQTNDELHEALQVLRSVVIQLPNANRDSMAFLFLHLRHVIDARAVTKMTSMSLGKIFAPTLVGECTQRGFRPSIGGNGCDKMASATKINMKQLTVMQSLFRLSKQFWNGILKDPNYCPFDTSSDEGRGRKSLNQTMIQKVSHTNLRDLIQAGNNNNPLY